MSETNWRERHGPDREINEEDILILAYFTSQQNGGRPAQQVGKRSLTTATLKRIGDECPTIEAVRKVKPARLLRLNNAARKRMNLFLQSQPKFMGRHLPMPLAFRLDQQPRRGRPKKKRSET